MRFFDNANTAPSETVIAASMPAKDVLSPVATVLFTAAVTEDVLLSVSGTNGLLFRPPLKIGSLLFSAGFDDSSSFDSSATASSSLTSVVQSSLRKTAYIADVSTFVMENQIRKHGMASPYHIWYCD